MNGLDIYSTDHGQSPTAIVYEAARLYGAAPERDEFDPRDVWDERDALFCIRESLKTIADVVTPNGTQLEDERESLLWGFVNMLDAQVRRLDRSIDKLTPELRDLQHAQDGTEIQSNKLELITDQAQNLGKRRDAFEQMRDEASDTYRQITGDVWRPRTGSHTSQTRKMTASSIEARDYLRAKAERKSNSLLPDGTLIAIAGGNEVSNADAIFRRLEKAHEKYPDMVLVHGGAPGVEQIAASWADRNDIHQIVCNPDWKKHGKAAPFRRNEDLLQLMPRGILAFPGAGITENLIDKAIQLGIPVHRCSAS